MRSLSPAALDVLGSGLNLSGRNAVIARQLDRKLYTEVNAALEALGGTWNRKARAHVFEQDPADALDRVLVDGGFHDVKRDLDQFFTPPELAKRVVEMADVRGKWVLEPSAGAGALALWRRCGKALPESHALRFTRRCARCFEICCALTPCATILTSRWVGRRTSSRWRPAWIHRTWWS